MQVWLDAQLAPALAGWMTKDIDSVRLQERLGPPPRLIWLTCGNTSNEVLRALLARHRTTIAGLLEAGNPLVEVGPLDF